MIGRRALPIALPSVGAEVSARSRFEFTLMVVIAVRQLLVDAIYVYAWRFDTRHTFFDLLLASGASAHTY